MKVYQFRNLIKNQQIWPRCFVAFSLREAQQLAQEFQDTLNEANGNVDWLKLSLDMENVTIVDTDKSYQRRGYIEPKWLNNTK